MTATVICAFIADKVDKRILTAVGLFLLGVAGIILGFLNLQISNINIMIPNFIMGLGMGLSFVPIINLSMETISNVQMTNATGLQNLLKNIGSAIGTSLVATMITRFGQMHQFMMVGKLNDLNPVFVERVQTTTAALSQYTHVTVAKHMAEYSQYGTLLKQSSLWAFMDSFRIFGVLCFMLIPLLLLFKRNNAEQK